MTSGVDGTIQFLTILADLKRTKRQGWVEQKVDGPESVADHSYRMSVMAMLCPDPTLNRDRMMRMALCHDIAEAIVGDITPAMKVPAEEKERQEREAFGTIVGNLPGVNGEEVRLLWEEYEAQETAEAHFVRDLDLLEMVAQAHRYEQTQEHLQLDSFFRSAAKIKHPWAKEIADRLIATRSARPAPVGEPKA
jgi:putative hydrolase of HD superfamily